jgi:hypothetical protein
LKTGPGCGILCHLKEVAMLSTYFGLFIMPGLILVLALVLGLRKGGKK